MFDREKIIITVIILTLVFSLFTIFVSSDSIPSVSARAAALYEPESGSFLFNKNANTRLGMASTTKILTALIAIEKLSPDEEITVDDNAVGIEGSSIYLEHGEKMRAIDLIYSVMLQSANDAAAALAYRISGGIDEFASLMNDKVSEYGLNDTHFTNPHGLDSKEHYTTAHDLAIISAKALENDTFKKIVSTRKTSIESSLKTRVLVNHNKLLSSYDGCIGVKTGYTKKSGRSLVSAAEKDHLTMISVTIDAPNDWSDHKKMLDYGYSLLEAKILATEGEYKYDIPVMNGNCDYVSVSNKEELKLITKKDGKRIKSQVKLNRFISAPVSEGDVLGEVVFSLEGKTIGSVELTADFSVNSTQRKKFSFFK